MSAYALKRTRGWIDGDENRINKKRVSDKSFLAEHEMVTIMPTLVKPIITEYYSALVYHGLQFLPEGPDGGPTQPHRDQQYRTGVPPPTPLGNFGAGGVYPDGVFLNDSYRFWRTQAAAGWGGNVNGPINSHGCESGLRALLPAYIWPKDYVIPVTVQRYIDIQPDNDSYSFYPKRLSSRINLHAIRIRGKLNSVGPVQVDVRLHIFLQRDRFAKSNRARGCELEEYHAQPCLADFFLQSGLSGGQMKNTDPAESSFHAGHLPGVIGSPGYEIDYRAAHWLPHNCSPNYVSLFDKTYTVGGLQSEWVTADQPIIDETIPLDIQSEFQAGELPPDIAALTATYEPMTYGCDWWMHNNLIAFTTCSNGYAAKMPGAPMTSTYAYLDPITAVDITDQNPTFMGSCELLWTDA